MSERKTMFRFEQLGTVQKLYVYDDVTACGNFNWETWEYDDSETSAGFFREKLNAIGEEETIELHVNSNGGDVKEGVAIYNILKQHKAYKICYVDGFAYSVASVICMACDKIIMGLGTSMLIHNMAAYVYGNASQLRKMADDLDILMESNRKIYMERAKNLTEEQLSGMMDKETFLTPDQCLEYGFCDEIGVSTLNTSQSLEQAHKAMMELRQELCRAREWDGTMRELRQQMVQDTKKPKEEPKLLNSKEKALKLTEAFFNAFT